MKENRTTFSPGTLVKPILEITGSVAAVVAYLQSIFKLVDTAFPNTLSLLTIFFTSVMLVGWRWGKLNQKKKKPAKNDSSKSSSKATLLQRITEPIRDSKQDYYLLPLPRRRTEAGFIAAVAVFTFGWTGFNVPDVITELTSDPSLVCSIAKGENNLLIVVADLLETGEQELLVSDKIYEELVKNQEGNSYNVCRLSETFEVNTKALEKAQLLNADIMLWGRKDKSTYEVHLNAPVFSDPDRKISVQTTEKATSPEFQLAEPEHIAYVTEFTLSEVLLLNGEVTKAQTRLKVAIQKAQTDNLNSQNIAEGYYLLGVLYDPYNSGIPDTEKAIEAYGKAVDLDQNLFEARLSRGLLLGDFGRVDEAMVEFNFLIENDTPLKGDALLYRALLQTDPKARLRDIEAAIAFDPAEGYFYLGIEHMNQQDYKTAIQDFKTALEYDPNFFANYLYLGLSQLHAGEYDAAKDTFKNIVPYLTEEDRTFVIEQLRDTSRVKPEVDRVVIEIIDSLQAVEMP